jgi:methionyl-tRNA synthetase
MGGKVPSLARTLDFRPRLSDTLATMENTTDKPATECSLSSNTPSACAAPTQSTPPPPPLPEEDVDIDLFARVKLRTATIESAELVPKSKKLYKLQLDVGELGKRQIVSGIAQHYTPEQLVGKQIVIVANLKPAKLMGVESQGMLLAASTDGDGALAILTPDKPIPSGSRVR